MSRQGYAGRRNNPWVLTGIVAAHVAALTVVALAKMDLVGPPTFKRLITENIRIDQPPPPEPPPPVDRKVDERKAQVESRIDVVKPRVDVPTTGPVLPAPPSDYEVPVIPGPVGPETVEPAVVPKLDPPVVIQPLVRAAVKLKPRTNPASWVTNDDYPASALRAEEQGRTGFRLDIDASGRVTACDVTASSGSSTLDAATCRLLTRRAKFVSGTDAEGNAVGGSYANSFNWRIPED